MSLRQQYVAPGRHTHAHMGRCVQSAFLCVSLSLQNACLHTLTTSKPCCCLERTIAHAMRRSKVRYSSGRAQTLRGLCMCARLLFSGSQHAVYFYTLATQRSAFTLYMCAALTVFVSKPSPAASNPAPRFIIQALVCLFTQYPGATASA